MNRTYLAIFLLIILAAGVIRFSRLDERGLFSPDETRYYRDALVAKKSIDGYLSSVSPKTTRGFAASLLPLVEAFAGKPGHTLLGMLGLYLFGMHQYSVLFTSAFFGVLTVILIFLIGKKFFNPKVALLAALILSICPAHIMFSRSFLAHANQAFFLVLAVYLYLNDKKGWAALCLGYAFLVHPTGVIYFLPFLLCEVFLLFKKERILSRVFIFCLLFLAPFIAVEAISVLGRPDFGSLLTALNKSYASQVLFTKGEAAQLGSLNNKSLGPYHYLVMSQLANGWIYTILLILGACFYAAYFIKTRRFADFVLGIIPLILFFYWQFVSVHERLFREIIFLLPFFSLAAGVLISRINRKIIFVLMTLLAFESAVYVSKVIAVKSEYPKMEKFLSENKVDKIISPSEYLATTHDILMPALKNIKFYPVSSLDEARAISSREGVNYLITMSGILPAESLGRLLISIKDPNSVYYPFVYEAKKMYGKIYSDTALVSVYNIRKEKME